MKRKKHRDERLSIEKQYSKPGGVMIMHTGKSEIFEIPEKAFRAETEGRIKASKDDGAIAKCPHCKTKWVWSDDNWFTAIKLHGGHCQCPDNWKCTICNGKILNPADFVEYEKNGAHVECVAEELTGTKHFPPCEKEEFHRWTPTKSTVYCVRCGETRSNFPSEDRKMSIDTSIADENTWNLLQEQAMDGPSLCPVSGWNAEMCGCLYGVHEKVIAMEQELERLKTRLENAESVVFKYAQETNWFSSQRFTDLDDPEKRLYQDVWNFDSEDGFELAQTYLKVYGVSS